MSFTYSSLIYEVLNNYAKERFCAKGCNKNVAILEFVIAFLLTLFGIGLILFTAFDFILFVGKYELRHCELKNQTKDVDEVNSIVE